MSTKIEWTDDTWNPVRGCSIVSPGCTNCYAMRQAHRFSGAGQPYEGLTKLTKGGPVWTGEVRCVPQLLDAPLHWRKPRRVFVNSMSDLFHEDVDGVFIGSVLGIAAACPQHTFQVLTKRPARMRDVLKSEAFLEAYESSLEMYTHTDVPWPAANIWLGISVEDQARADERIPLLLQTPAAVRWISAEPLLGPLDLDLVDCMGAPTGALQWVVAGGESGPGARPMHPDWARSLRDQCAAAGLPFFFKQWGEWWEAASELRDDDGNHHEVPVPSLEAEEWFEDGGCLIAPDGRVFFAPGAIPPDVPCRHMIRVGKRAAGRLLDGCTHDEYPR